MMKRALLVLLSVLFSGTVYAQQPIRAGGGGGGGTTGGATAVKQSDGTQKTQIVDGAGSVIASTSNNLNVECANCSGSGVSAADEASITEGTSIFAAAGGYFKSAITPLTTGQQGMVALTASRSFHVSFYDAAGNALLGQKTSAGSVPVALASDASLVITSATLATAAKQPALGTAGTASSDVITIQGVAGMTKLLVTPDLPTGAATAAKQPALGTAGSGSSDVITVQGNASGTPIPVSVSNGSSTGADDSVDGTSKAAVLPCTANASAPSWNEGHQEPCSVNLAGSQRTIAVLQTQTDTVMVGGVNVKEINAVAPLMGNGTTGAGALRVSIASDSTGQTKLTDGTNSAIIDPCVSSGAALFRIALSQTASGVVKSGTSSKRTYICSVMLVSADGENISFVSGSGSACGTSTVADIGATTAANGMNLAANGGFVLSPGAAAWAQTTVNADDLCLLQSGSGRISGVMTVAVQ